MGGDLGGTEGRVPQKTIEVGTANASVRPIFLEVALRDVQEKYEVTIIKGKMKKFFVK